MRARPGGIIVYEIPPNELLSDTERAQRGPGDAIAEPFIARQVVIPETVVVHLGVPSRKRRKCLCFLSGLHQKRRVLRNLPDVVGGGASRKHFSDHFLNAQPHLHGMVSQPGL